MTKIRHFQFSIIHHRSLFFSGRLLLAFMLGSLSFVDQSFAVSLEALDSSQPWRLAGIELQGNDKLDKSDLRDAILSPTRPWYRFWASDPAFDPVTFREDLERLRRLYESRGFYHAEINYDLVLDKERGLIHAEIVVTEGTAVIVADVDVAAAGVSSFPPSLPIKTGDRFSEAAYQQSEIVLKQFYGDEGYAYVESDRKAEVVLDSDQAFVSYNIKPGPPSVFGQTTIEGTRDVDPEIIRRELLYQPGEPYSVKKITETRDKLIALDLFGSVNIAPVDDPAKPATVPMLVRVTEKEPREIKLSLGYGTEDQFRTQLEWRHNNWLGDGRRLSLTAKYSSLEASGILTFIQPHLFSPRGRGVITLRRDRVEEETYLQEATRFNPRFEYRFNQNLSAFGGYRLEHDRFDNITDATVTALGGVEKHGLISGPSLGATWTRADNPLNPSVGEVATFNVEQSGAPWGGSYRFYRLIGEGRKYWSIGWQTVFATRLKLGFAEPIGNEANLPLSERLYAGGERSVRGYARRRLGPLSPSNDPIGGLSLLEGSLEVRRPLWRALGGALFVDFGQVSRRSFDIPVKDLKFSAGFGLSYTTPVGPLRVDVGFPFDPPHGDRAFQIHFSVGAAF